jgi:PAS domain S-box-containing protein
VGRIYENGILYAEVQGRAAELEREVIERRRAEKSVRQSEARNAAILHVSMDAIITMDSEGKIRGFNPAAARIFGYTETEILGKPLACLIPPSLAHRHSQGLARYLVTGETTILEKRLEMPAMRANGSEFPVELSVTRIPVEGPPMFTGYLRDITERKQAEEQVLRLNQELEQRVKERTAELEAANRELEAFAYSISHDLRAPLRAIDGFSRILLKDCAALLPGDARGYLEDVRHSAQEMGQLVDGLLTFSRLTRQPVLKQPIASTRFVRHCLEELRHEQEGRNVEIRIGELAACQADPTLLKRVWVNLISNALKYTSKREAAVIEIGCCNGESSGGATYFVKDNGVGFDMRYADKLFGVFQRLHRDEDFEGTGVGLAIVHRIVDRHGGRVWAEAQPDKGATFYFTLENGRKSPLNQE